MSNIAIFHFETNRQVRIAQKGDEPYFCLKDVTDVLEIQNANQMVAKQLDLKGIAKIQILDSLNRTQVATFINEPNLYRVIFRSNKKEAVKFQNWVFDEVLPSIRKTGHYRHTITPAQQQAIRVAVAKVCKNRRTHYQTVYETLKSHFEIPRYSELLACDFEEAMALISSFSPNVTTNNSLRYNAQCLAWHAYVIASWYKAIEPHFRALSPQLCGEIHDHISHAKIFAIGINHQIGLGQMTPMLPHLETKRWAIAY